jgi:ATP/ADP translocase/HEAT repeat protein
MNINQLKEYIRSGLNLKPGEGRLAGLMFLYNFVLLVTLYLLKPVRDSLFLVEMGPEQLPLVFIFTALAVIPISMAYSRFSGRLSLGWVINGVTAFLSATLILIWWLLQIDSSALYYVLYIWVSIYSVLITSQFWLLANSLFDAVQAKRIFSLLSVAAIAGAIAGGEITGLLVDELDIAAQNLLLIGALLLFSTVFLVKAIRSAADRRSSAERGSISGRQESGNSPQSPVLFSEIIKSRHLLLIVGIIAVSVITTTVIDYQFKTIASRVYPTDNGLTVFMGHFYGRLSIIALLLQLFLSPKFIERRGVGSAVAILPGILLLGSVGLFIWPVLASAVLLRGADQSLKHSLDRTGRELLFIPVELDLKKRTKVFIDLFVDNGAQGLAGLLLLLLTFVMSLSIQHLSFVVIGLLVFWIMLAVLVRQSYVNEFRESLEEQVNQPDKKSEFVSSEDSLEMLLRKLKSGNEAGILTSLKNLEEEYSREDIPVEILEKLLTHTEPKIRKQSVHIFRTKEIDGYLEPVAELLEDPAADVRLEAARYIYLMYDPEEFGAGRLEILQDGLDHEDIKIRAAAFGLIAKDLGDSEKALLNDDLLEKTLTYTGEGQEELKIQTARVLGVAYKPSRRHILQALLYDSSEEVVKQAIISAGESGDRIFIHILLEYLDSAAYKKKAQHALSIYGRRIFGTLFDYLTDEKIVLAKRLSIPSILFLNSSQVALNVLQLALDEDQIPIRYEIIKAMNKIKQKLESPEFNNEKLKQTIYEEAKMYALLKQSLLVLEQTNGDDEIFNLLDREIKRSFENIFRLLGLVYNSEDIYNAYKGILSDKTGVISEGVEFVENIIEWDVKRFLQPLLESIISEQQEYGEFTDEIRTPEEAVFYISGLGHPQFQDLNLDMIKK